MQVFRSKKSAQVDNRGASPLCAVIILRSVSPPALELRVLHTQGLAWCLEHNRYSVYLYGLVDKMNKILLLLASLPQIQTRPPGEMAGNVSSSGEAILPTPPNGSLSCALRNLLMGFE